MYCVGITLVVLRHCHDNHRVFLPTDLILDPFEVHMKVWHRTTWLEMEILFVQPITIPQLWVHLMHTVMHTHNVLMDSEASGLCTLTILSFETPGRTLSREPKPASCVHNKKSAVKAELLLSTVTTLVETNSGSQAYTTVPIKIRPKALCPQQQHIACTITSIEL